MRDKVSLLGPLLSLVATFGVLFLTVSQGFRISELNLVTAQQIDDLSRVVERPNLEIVSVGITAHTPGLYFDSWADENLYSAPPVPDDAVTYTLNDIISCRPGFQPVAAWSETHTSWPDPAVMYSVNADLKGDHIQISLRSRDADRRGYAYIDVLVLCHG